MMECSRIKKMLSAYLDEELSEEELREVRKHIFICPECERELKKMQNMKNMVAQIDRSFQPRTNLAIRYETLQSRNNGHRMREILYLSMVACIVFLLFTFVFPAFQNGIQRVEADASVGEIHRTLSGDSYDVPENSGRIVVNFLRQYSNDGE